MIDLGHSEENAFKMIFEEFMLTGAKNSNWENYFLDIFGFSVNDFYESLQLYTLDLEDETIAVMWQQNVLNSFRLSQHVAKRMIKQSEDDSEADGIIGTIVNLSSIASTLAQPRLLGYSIATAAMDQMTRSLAVSLAPSRIRVNSLAIGSIMSASLQNSLKDADELRQDIEAHTPMGRIASASEIVETVQYLAAPASGFVTGQIITVDGGRCLLDPVSSPFH